MFWNQFHHEFSKFWSENNMKTLTTSVFWISFHWLSFHFWEKGIPLAKLKTKPSARRAERQRWWNCVWGKFTQCSGPTNCLWVSKEIYGLLMLWTIYADTVWGSEVWLKFISNSWRISLFFLLIVENYHTIDQYGELILEEMHRRTRSIHIHPLCMAFVELEIEVFLKTLLTC